MNYSMTDVQYTICDNQGYIFEYIANQYTFDTFLQFVPAFMNSEFCQTQWDVPYSPYQFALIDENLDFLMPELKKSFISRLLLKMTGFLIRTLPTGSASPTVSFRF